MKRVLEHTRGSTTVRLGKQQCMDLKREQLFKYTSNMLETRFEIVVCLLCLLCLEALTYHPMFLNRLDKLLHEIWRLRSHETRFVPFVSLDNLLEL